MPADDTASAKARGKPAADEAAAFRNRHPDITQIDALIPDTSGVLRGKKLPAAGLAKLYGEGIALPGSVFATDITGSTVEETGLGFADGDADRMCRPIPGRLSRVPWLARPTGQVLLTMRDLDGGPFYAEPRAVLAGVVDRLAADGLIPVVAIELEFYLIDRERDADGRPRPPRVPRTRSRQSTNQVYGIDELYEFEELLHDVGEACRAQGIPVESAVSEYAPGQYEINLRHVADAVRACDDAVLFKRAVKGVAAKHGAQASFMAKPYGDRAGSGLHIHLSLVDAAGVNVFAADDPAGSPTLRHALGGLAATMAEAMALFAPNPNAFRRFQPNAYVPLAPAWGVNNRSVALRIPAGGVADRRVEHRVAGADANPYLVTAAVLTGVHHGLRRRLDPGPPVTGNGYESVARTLTSSWVQALEALAGSAVFADYFGRRFLDVYLALKWSERDRFFATVTPLEYDWYLDKA